MNLNEYPVEKPKINDKMLVFNGTDTKASTLTQLKDTLGVTDPPVYTVTATAAMTDSVVIIGDNNSQKKMTLENLVNIIIPEDTGSGDGGGDNEAGSPLPSTSDEYFNWLDSFISVEQRRQIYRGKEITFNPADGENAVQKELIKNMANGTFKGLFIGDILNWGTYGKFIITDFDYWYGLGDAKCTKHHISVTPLLSSAASIADTMPPTTDGYNTARSSIKFNRQSYTDIYDYYFTNKRWYTLGPVNWVLDYRDIFSTEINSSGEVSNTQWANARYELPTEIMLYGWKILPETLGRRAYSISNRQLSIFKMINPKLIFKNSVNNNIFLRDIIKVNEWACLIENGCVSSTINTIKGFAPPFFGITMDDWYNLLVEDGVYD